MTTRPCLIVGCPKEAHGFSTLCTTHKLHKRRHGDPLQVPLQARDLKPYVLMVEQRMDRNPESPAWTILTAHWEALVAHHKAHLEGIHQGHCFNLHAMEASNQILRLDHHSEARKVLAVALAMYLIQEFEPRRFMSDKGFDFMLVRQVRGLSPLDVGQYWNHRTRRMHKVYREMKPRTVEVLAAVLKGTFGLAGLTLARKERQDNEDRATAGMAQRKRLAEALEAMA